MTNRHFLYIHYYITWEFKPSFSKVDPCLCLPCELLAMCCSTWLRVGMDASCLRKPINLLKTWPFCVCCNWMLCP